MPQPGMNGMEPAFGEAYGGHRGLLSPYPLAMSPLGGRTEYDQSVLLMLGSPATPRKRPFELLSDLVDDGGTFGEDLHPERWDVSALDEMTRYTKLGLGVGVGGEPASASEEETTVLMGRWEGRSWEEEEEEKTRRRARSEEAAGQPRQQQQPAGSGGGGGALGGGQLATAAERASVSVTAAAAEKGASGGLGAGGAGQNGAMMRRGHMVEVYQVAQEEEEAAAAAAAAALAARAASALGLALEHCSSEEHNYSLCQGGGGGGGGGGGEPGVDAPHPHHHHLPQTEEEEEEEEEEGRAEEATPRHKDRVEEESPPRKGDISELEEEEVEDDEEEQEEEEEEDEDEGEEGAEETTVEAEDSSSSETEGEVEAEPAKRPGERPQKRRCFWEYRRARESAAKKKLGGEVRWSLSWSSSTLPSTLYRREGKKGRRKARKTDASDLTPNPQKLHNIGEQLQKLNAAIDGMGPVNDLPAVARARSRKEKNKLASRACRLKKKAQHEANKIKLWGLNQEYENLLGALLRIKEVIRRRVESSEEEDTDERGMTQRLEDILKESSGPLVAGRTKDFVQRILAASAVGQSNKGKETAQGGEDEEAG